MVAPMRPFRPRPYLKRRGLLHRDPSQVKPANPRAAADAGPQHLVAVQSVGPNIVISELDGTIYGVHHASKLPHAGPVAPSETPGKAMHIARRFTTAGQDPYARVAFRSATSEIRNPDGSVV